MSGAYPPGVTQRDIDIAAGGYDESQRCTVCGQMRDRPCREGDCGNEPIIIVPCRGCNGEGRLYRTRYGGNDPDWIDCGPCPDCGGTGAEMIEGEPLEEEDLFSHEPAQPPNQWDMPWLIGDEEISIEERSPYDRPWGPT